MENFHGGKRFLGECPQHILALSLFYWLIVYGKQDYILIVKTGSNCHVSHRPHHGEGKEACNNDDEVVDDTAMVEGQWEALWSTQEFL